MSAIDETKQAYRDLQEKYNKNFPKVRTELLNNLLHHLNANPSDDPIFMVEVFTRPGLDPQQIRRYILEKTGMSPEIYDNGTHYVTNQKLNLEILKEIADSDDVIDVTGEYTGRLGGFGPSHEHRENENTPGSAGGRGMPPSS
ncbi:MAG TPA: hypothetical protein VHA09_00465 [Nitrososphaera sp.]|nr:hypothetical protein [Nitrososphaera sp.]